jgi:hypothetical protein
MLTSGGIVAPYFAGTGGPGTGQLMETLIP